MHLKTASASPPTSASGETTRRNSDDPEVVDVDGQQGGVNVAQAKKEFSDLQRNLSRQSSLRRQKSRNSEKGQANFDPEKGGEQGEEFNLLEYLVSIFLTSCRVAMAKMLKSGWR